MSRGWFVLLLKMGSNIFEPSIKSNLRKVFELYRVDFRLALLLLKSMLKSALTLRIKENEKTVYYYYLTLIHCKCYHREYKSPKFYFGKNNVSFVARAGNGFSDLENFNQLFGRKEYKEIIDLYKNNFLGDAGFIIDAGANVGYATLYFHSFYPKAKFICIEPDVNNFSILEENCRFNKLQQSFLVNYGLWNKDAYLALTNDPSTMGTWGFAYRESRGPTNIKALDFKKLLKDRNFTVIDILKIDIEGAEAILFENNSYMKDILSITKVIGIEIHDHLANREKITSQLLDAGFVLHNAGDMTFGYNLTLKNYKI